MWLQQKVGKVHRRCGTVWKCVQKVKYVGKCCGGKSKVSGNVLHLPCDHSVEMILTRMKKCAWTSRTVTTFELIDINQSLMKQMSLHFNVFWQMQETVDRKQTH